MKNIATIIIGIVLAVDLGATIAYHAEIDKPTQQEAPAEAPVDSSWLWTDFSHPDTLHFLDFPGDKYRQVYFSAYLSYHSNGMLAMKVETYSKLPELPHVIEQHLIFYSSNGYKIAEDLDDGFTYKDFLSGIRRPKIWMCIVSNGRTKNPSACPEPSPETHIYNHKVKETKNEAR